MRSLHPAMLKVLQHKFGLTKTNMPTQQQNRLPLTDLRDLYLRSILATQPLLFLDSSLGLLFTSAAGATPSIANNDAVGLWNDRSVSGFHMAAGTAVALQTTVSAYKNRNTVLFAAASSQYLVRSMGGVVANRSTYNIIAVLNSVDSAAIKCIYAEYATGSNTPFLRIRTKVTNEGEVIFEHRSDAATL